MTLGEPGIPDPFAVYANRSDGLGAVKENDYFRQMLHGQDR
jgi:hypothetical protein